MNKLYKYTGSVSSLSYHKITPDSLPWVDLFLYDIPHKAFNAAVVNIQVFTAGKANLPGLVCP